MENFFLKIYPKTHNFIIKSNLRNCYEIVNLSTKEKAADLKLSKSEINTIRIKSVSNRDAFSLSFI